MEIKRINKDACRLLRAEIDQALAEIARKHDLKKLAIGNISFTEGRFTTRLTCETKLERSEDRQASANDSMFFVSVGLPQNALNMIVKDNLRNRRYKIVGSKPRSRNCILIQDLINERTYKASPEMVKRWIELGGTQSGSITNGLTGKGTTPLTPPRPSGPKNRF